MANLLPQLRVQASESNDLQTDGWLQEAAAFLPLPLVVLLVSNSSISNNGEDPHTALG